MQLPETILQKILSAGNENIYCITRKKELIMEIFTIDSGISPVKFRDPASLTNEQLNDPDYAFKELERLNGGKLAITCSRCHHCR